MTVVASDVFVAQKPGEERVELRVEVGTPWQEEPHVWACPVSVTPLYKKLQEARGDSSLQALCLAVSLARSLLEGFVEDGGHLTYPSGGAVDLKATFGVSS